MSKCYIAIKLEPLDVISGRIPGQHDNYPCALCETAADALQYLETAKATPKYPTMVTNMHVPDVNVILTYDILPHLQAKGIVITDTNVLRHMKSQTPINKSIIMCGDALHKTEPMPTESTETGVYRYMADMAKRRAETVSECEQCKHDLRVCGGIQEWFQHVVAANPNYEYDIPSAKEHVAYYAAEFFATREENPQMSSEIVIYESIVLAAQRIQAEMPLYEELFSRVEDLARNGLWQQCANELVFYEPTEYLTRTLPMVPPAYQTTFLNAFNEILDELQQEYPELTSEQQAAVAMNKTARMVQDSIMEAQVEGIFGQAPHMTHNAFMQLDTEKKQMIELSAITQINVELVDAMVARLPQNNDEQHVGVDTYECVAL